MSKCGSCPSKAKCGKQEASCSIENNPRNQIKHVVAIMSGKGGVGKSSMTVLLAKQLVKKGYKVGIMDADITGPSIPRLLGVEKEKAYGSKDAIQPVIDKDGIKVISLNFLIEDENQPVLWRGPIIGNVVKQFWTDVIWEELDYLLIDMPPGTGDVAMTVLQNIPVNGVVMISTPQPMVSMIVSKAINMCKQVNVPVFGIIENMSYMICPDCGKRIEIFKHKNTEEFLSTNDVELWAELPMMESVSQIYYDDNFDINTVKCIEEYMKHAVEKLIEKCE